MIGCAGQSTQETGFLISMGCHMTQGSSGGPWIQNLNPYTNGGNIVISVVSHGKQTSERDKFYGPLFNAQNFTPLCEADPTDGWPGCHP